MNSLLPYVDFFGHKVTRLVCGGNPLTGFSHFSSEMDRDMIDYYTMPAIQSLLNECWENGINTLQSRGDRHQQRAYLEHRLSGGKMQWIAQTTPELADLKANIADIAAYKAIAIYHHGTHTDNHWHAGEIEKIRDLIKAIHDQGLPAGIGTHIPEVVEYCEEHGWETDFYMCCFYNLARGYKLAPAVDKNAYEKDRFPEEDPYRMTEVIRKVTKPCIGFKILAANRKCSTPESVKEAFRFALENIKPTDIVDVGMFQKYKNQVAENAGFVREILESRD